MNETLQRKRDAFQKTLIDNGRYMDMDHNSQLYKTRSSDLHKLQNVIGEINTSHEVGVDSDKKLTRRQFEINEWAYNNKLETLFLLQLLLISVLVLVLFLFLSKQGYISGTVAGTLSVLFFLVVAYVAYVRWGYTSSIRDTRLWSRRSFPVEAPNMNSGAAMGRCDAQGNYVLDLSQLVPDVITKNAQSLQNKFNSVTSELDSQVAAYQTTGAIPTCKPPSTAMTTS
jgi:hypothetical protein